MKLRTAILLLTALATMDSRAQSSAEVNAGLQFDFGSPGARSLALGGAFVGIADDATAVFVNPGGLAQLSKYEAALDFRGFEHTNSFTSGGRGKGMPTSNGIDTSPSLIEGSATHDIKGLTFASVVVPFRRSTFAVYRHELANFRASARTEGAFFQKTTLGKDQNVRMSPSISRLDLNIISHGVSYAFAVTDNLSVGASVARQWFDLLSKTSRYGDPEAGLFAAADYRSPLKVEEQRGRDIDMAIHVGGLWKLGEDFSIGGSYQKGSDFDVDVRSFDPEKGPESAPVLRAQFHVPSVFRLGCAYSLRDFSKISIEVDRIRYSRLTQDLVVLHGESPTAYRAADATEIHVGFQHFFVSDSLLRRTRYPVVLSFGLWRDPDHRIWYDNPENPQSYLFRKGRDEYHGSIGLALAGGERYEFGIAYDHSRQQKTGSVSMVVRF